MLWDRRLISSWEAGIWQTSGGPPPALGSPFLAAFGGFSVSPPGRALGSGSFAGSSHPKHAPWRTELQLSPFPALQDCPTAPRQTAWARQPLSSLDTRMPGGPPLARWAADLHPPQGNADPGPWPSIPRAIVSGGVTQIHALCTGGPSPSAGFRAVTSILCPLQTLPAWAASPAPTVSSGITQMGAVCCQVLVSGSASGRTRTKTS